MAWCSVKRAQGDLHIFGCRWEDNIKIGLKEIACEGVDWIPLAVFWNTVMNFGVP
jgi:hypothetical protein